MWNSKRLKTRLIRGIDGEDVNDTIADLESEYCVEVVTVFPRLVTYSDGSMNTVYDILVKGDSDPTWGIYAP